jgi:hypothetical protein
MIDDMMTTRKVALAIKKKRLEDDPTDALPMAEIWCERNQTFLSSSLKLWLGNSL